MTDKFTYYFEQEIDFDEIMKSLDFQLRDQLRWKHEQIFKIIIDDFLEKIYDMIDDWKDKIKNFESFKMLKKLMEG